MASVEDWPTSAICSDSRRHLAQKSLSSFLEAHPSESSRSILHLSSSFRNITSHHVRRTQSIDGRRPNPSFLSICERRKTFPNIFRAMPITVFLSTKKAQLAEANISRIIVVKSYDSRCRWWNWTGMPRSFNDEMLLLTTINSHCLSSASSTHVLQTSPFMTSDWHQVCRIKIVVDIKIDSC